ncbi:MAG TPA: hypothetical protein VKQ72_13515 [Aggregatilineales bacterium]|nr:hypothetical protein [Aggregatilineales bacterium]
MTGWFSMIAKQAWLRVGCVLTLGLILSGCGQGAVPTDNSAQNLMPVLPDYNTSSVLNIQDALAKLTSLAAAAGAQVEVSAGVAAVNGLVTCYEKAGALVGQAYVNKTNAVNSGLIIIVNQNQLTNPQVFTSCVVPIRPLAQANGAAPVIQPCTKSYTLNQNNNTFDIAYIGTNPTVCQAFCSGLKGCTAP